MPSQVIPAAASAWTFKGPGGRVARSQMDAFCSGTEAFAPAKVLASFENQRGASPTFELTFNGSSIVIYGAAMGATVPVLQVVLDNAAVRTVAVPSRVNASSNSMCAGVLAQLTTQHAVHTVTITPDTTRERLAIYSAVVDDVVATSTPTSSSSKPQAPPLPTSTHTTSSVPAPPRPPTQQPIPPSPPPTSSSPPSLPSSSSSQSASFSASQSQSLSGSGLVSGTSDLSSASASTSSSDDSESSSTSSSTLSDESSSSSPSETTRSSGSSPPDRDAAGRSKFGIVLGSVLGSLAVLFALVGAVLWPWYMRRRRQRSLETIHSDEAQYGGTDGRASSEPDLEPALRPYALSNAISTSPDSAAGAKLSAMKRELVPPSDSEEPDTSAAALVQAVRAAGFTMQAVVASLSRVRAASEDADAPPPGYDPRGDPQQR